MADLTQLQAAVDSLTAAAAKVTDAKAAGVSLLNRLAQLLKDNATDPAAIQAIADGISSNASSLNTSAEELMAAVLADTPAETPPTA